MPPRPAPDVDEGARALLTALEDASAAIVCLTAASLVPVWANGRGRSMGELGDATPTLDGRPVLDVVSQVLRTGRALTVTGSLADGPPGTAGAPARVLVRPLQIAGEPAALLVVESLTAEEDALGARQACELVEQAQHSLLPPSLPLMPHLRLSGSYQRATSARAAGGDWYDAVPLGGGRVALVLGDAVGHGVLAAGAMSRLRGAMRSTALRHPAPEDVLNALDAFAAQMDDVQGASVFYGVLDAVTGQLSYTAAGHPAPLLLHADGRTSVLPVAPRPPLGSRPDTTAPIARVTVGQGDALVIFSNGAVIGHGSGPGTAWDRIADVAREVLERPGALDADASYGLAAAIAEGVRRPEGWPDDVAVLVAHRRATAVAPLQLDLQALPAALPGVRRRLGPWLEELGMGEQDRVGVMVAVGEACANAAEHAYRGSTPGPLSVRAAVDVDGLLTVTVRDRGTWRSPDRDPGDRGRGLLIMRQLLDTVVMQEEQGTTVTMTLRLRRSVDEDPERESGPPGAVVAVDRSGNPPVVRVRGVADEATAEHLRIRMLEASRGGTTPIELDVTEVGLFSSAAVREVLAVARIAREESWRLLVRAPVGGVTRHVLEISGLQELVELR